MSKGTGTAPVPGGRETGDPQQQLRQNYAAGGTQTMDAFRPSSYTGKQTTTDAGITFACASGARRIMFQNLEITGQEEFAVVAFGTSAANAIVNLGVATVAQQGVIIPSVEPGAGASMPPPIIVGIPENAWGENSGYCALGTGVTTLHQIIMVTQGV